MPLFSLHTQLEKDTLSVGDLPLCRVLLMNQNQFPWLILVPRLAGMREIFDLSENDYTKLMHEIRFVSEAFSKQTKAHKINVAALGNMVPQLHVHIIVRYENDAAWPNPVWNSGIKTEPYQAEAIVAKTAELKALFKL